jgi:hypothetical protein
LQERDIFYGRTQQNKTMIDIKIDNRKDLLITNTDPPPQSAGLNNKLLN